MLWKGEGGAAKRYTLWLDFKQHHFYFQIWKSRFSNLKIPIFKFEYPDFQIWKSRRPGSPLRHWDIQIWISRFSNLNIPNPRLEDQSILDLKPPWPLTKSLIWGKDFIVESEKYPDRVYNLNMKSGFCTCGKGVNFAPCKHKSAVASLYNIAEFSVAPFEDLCARALYHYIATGTTLPAHMYRVDRLYQKLRNTLRKS